MIRHAYIYSKIGTAIFVEDGDWYVLNSNKIEESRNWHLFDNNIFSSYTGNIVYLENPTMGDLKKQLLEEKKKQEALTLTLQLMDVEIGIILKEEIANLLNNYLSDDTLFLFVENKILATVVPKDFNPQEALDICLRLNLKKLIRLYKYLVNSIETIGLFYTHWNNISIRKIENVDFEGKYLLLSEKGLIKSFIQSIYECDELKWKKTLESVCSIIGESFNGILIEIKEKIEAEKIRSSLSINTKKNDYLELDEKIQKLIVNFVKVLKENRTRKASRKDFEKLGRFKNRRNRGKENLLSFDLDQIKLKINFYRDDIIFHLKNNKPHSSYKSLYKLLIYQIKESDSKHLVKTLCNISQDALELKKFDFAHSLIRYSKLLKVNDPVIYCQYAQILKTEGSLEEAKTEYLQIIKEFPKDLISRCGYAEVLKSLGNLEEAKLEYKKIIEDFPKNPYPKISYTDILKIQGFLQNAKTEYIKIIAEFPDEISPKCSLAEILKTEGNFEESKLEFLKIIEKFPDEVIPQNGYAQVLEAQGYLEEAKSEFLKIIERFPDAVVPQCGYAEVLKAQGNLEEAKIEYEKIFKNNPENSIVTHSLAFIYLLLNQKEEYLSIYKKSESPKSQNDYYWHYLNIICLLKESNYFEARNHVEFGIANCKFYSSLILYKRTLKYIKIQTNEFNNILNKKNPSNQGDHPVDLIFKTHILAETNKKTEAKNELNKCKKFKEIDFIYKASCVLSEKYDLNGLPRLGLTIEKLDERIRSYELEALATLI